MLAAHHHMHHGDSMGESFGKEDGSKCGSVMTEGSGSAKGEGGVGTSGNEGSVAWNSEVLATTGVPAGGAAASVALSGGWRCDE